MSNYYEKCDAVRNIEDRLKKLGNWKIYGNGVAEKNGYVFVLNRANAEEEYVSRIRISGSESFSADIQKKIQKLEAMTVARGATPAEEATAKAKIAVLLEKKAKEGGVVYKEVRHPGHRGNPNRCNWHIEKDGVVIDKGNGIAKFADVPDITRSDVQKEWQEFNNLSREQWLCSHAEDYLYSWRSREEAWEMAERMYEKISEKYKTLEAFNKFIARVDSTCGGMMGDEDEFYTYKEEIVEELKEELKPFECSGSLKVGQCFILKSDFTRGHHRGYVYRVTNDYGNGCFIAYKLGRGYKKECKGNTPGNVFGINSSTYTQFMGWVNDGSIAFVELRTVKVKKKVKKMVKTKAC